MGKKTKIGKARKDKFYKLAKETGFRARSAFKLLQLNRKFEFLQKSRVCIDLCAAPGSWLQVAAQNMPISSVIIGVDLVPIKPVHHNVVTFTSDITTDKCRTELKKELKGWKADCVLNDGAPNVGKNWIQDAFSQAELTLEALKLATLYLRKGGWFVTKVFRSQDYHALMWVFGQLFRKVHATKPQASRMESAEIFVVCQNYLAPDKIDPKFLDLKYVFKQVETGPKNTLNLIHPEKRKKQAHGYADGDNTLHHKLPVTKFINADNYLELLADANQLVFDDVFIENHELTTPEIKICCNDIKVLGKKDIRNLVNWRKKINKELETLQTEDQDNTEDTKQGSDNEELVKSGSENENEEDSINQQLAELKDEEVKTLKRKLKKVRKEKAKLRQKMNMNMVIPGDKLEMTDDVNLFDLGRIKKKHELGEVEKGDMLSDDSDYDDSDDANILKKKHMQSFDRNEENVVNWESDDEESDENEDVESDLEMEEYDNGDQSEDDDDNEDDTSNPLVVELDEKEVRSNRKTEMWFNKDAFASLEEDDDEDLEIEQMTTDYKKKGGKILSKEKAKANKKNLVTSKQTEGDNDSDSGHVSKSDSNDSDASESSSDSDSDSDVNEVVQPAENNKRNRTKDGFEIVSAEPARKMHKLDPEGLAIGAAIATSHKRKRDIIDNSFNRYTFNDDGLPDWFVQEESKHVRRQMPVTKAEVEEYKLRMKAINARDIHKVAEAKGRKKRKAVKRLERARKKAESVTDSVDASEKEKWSQIKGIYKKAGLLKEKKKEVQYVVARSTSGKRVSRPPGVKGRFKVVDPRMKKDNRREKYNNKQAKGKKKGNKRK